MGIEESSIASERVACARTTSARAAAAILVMAGALPWMPAHAAGAEMRRLAVLEFRGSNLSAETLGKMSDEVRAGALDAMPQGSGYIVISRENMMVLLRAMSGARCEEGECEVETARNIGAQLVVTGETVQVEGTLLTTLKLHETERGALLATQSTEAKGPLDAIRQLRATARDLVRSGMRFGPRKTGTALESTVGPELEQPLVSLDLPDVEEVVVQFDSSPVGAIVRVDGELLCNATPCSKRLAAGPHEVQMEQLRHTPSTTRIEVKRGIAVSLTLEPLFGWLTVRTEPEGLAFSLARAGAVPERMKAPVENRPTDPGGYQIAIDEPCYRQTGRTIEVERGKTATVVVSAEPRQAAIMVVAEDEHGNDVEGDVFVDGVRMGTTGKYFGVPQCTKELEIRTAAGGWWSGRPELREGVNEKLTAKTRGGKLRDHIASGPSPVVPASGDSKQSSKRGYRYAAVAFIAASAVATAVAIHGFGQAKSARAELDRQTVPVDRSARDALLSKGDAGNVLGVVSALVGVAMIGGGVAFLSVSF